MKAVISVVAIALGLVGLAAAGTKQHAAAASTTGEMSDPSGNWATGRNGYGGWVRKFWIKFSAISILVDGGVLQVKWVNKKVNEFVIVLLLGLGIWCQHWACLRWTPTLASHPPSFLSPIPSSRWTWTPWWTSRRTRRRRRWLWWSWWLWPFRCWLCCCCHHPKEDRPTHPTNFAKIVNDVSFYFWARLGIFRICTAWFHLREHTACRIGLRESFRVKVWDELSKLPHFFSRA